MDAILSSLFRCAMEHPEGTTLTCDELRDYHKAMRSKEKLEEQLNAALQGEELRLFEAYTGCCSDADSLDMISAFRQGLAMGLKLGMFPFSEG